MWTKIKKMLRLFEGKFEEKFSDTPPHPRELLPEILDHIEDKIDLLNDDRRGFPFNLVYVHLLASDQERQDGFSAYYLDNEMLAQQIRRRLREKDCPPPARLQVELKFAENRAANWQHSWFHLECRGIAAFTGSAKEIAFVPAIISVVQGQTNQATYSLDTPRRVNVGRQESVSDKQGILKRRNHIAFLDDNNEINRSVGREHAHLNFDSATGEWRLFAESQTANTNIVRETGTVRVLPRSRRGERLQHGDEIICGRAVLQFELVAEPAED